MLDFKKLDETYKQLKDDIQAYSTNHEGTESALHCAQAALDGADSG